jgi:hypothetical protein
LERRIDMKKRIGKTLTDIRKVDRNREAVRRQQANYERFMQERADVFQVTEGKAQAMFWAMS